MTNYATSANVATLSNLTILLPTLGRLKRTQAIFIFWQNSFYFVSFLLIGPIYPPTTRSRQQGALMYLCRKYFGKFVGKIMMLPIVPLCTNLHESRYLYFNTCKLDFRSHNSDEIFKLGNTIDQWMYGIKKVKLMEKSGVWTVSCTCTYVCSKKKYLRGPCIANVELPWGKAQVQRSFLTCKKP